MNAVIERSVLSHRDLPLAVLPKDELAFMREKGLEPEIVTSWARKAGLYKTVCEAQEAKRCAL